MVCGSGISAWRSQDIYFELSGKLDLSTGKLELVKTHVGRFTNSVSYTCQVSQHGVIEGEYRRGTLALRRTGIIPVPSPAVLSGVWEGTSMSRKNPTEWKDTELFFAPGDTDGSGTIVGRGTSLWRRMEVSFEVTGTFDSGTGSFVIQKRHTGRFTNVIEYSGTFTPKMVDQRGRVMAMEGVYATGSVTLLRVRDLSPAAASALQERHGAALETDRAIREQEQEQKQSPDRESWVADQLEMRRQRQDDVAVTTEVEAMSKDDLTSLLSGIWSGKSIDRRGLTTEWVDTAVRVSFETTDVSSGELFGRGFSLWRDQRIEFDLSGTVDMKSKKVRLTKQHRGSYRNAVTYTGIVKVVRQRQGDGETTGPANLTVVIDGKYGNGEIRLRRDKPLSKAADSAAEFLESPLDGAEATTSDVRISNYRMFLIGLVASGTISSREQELADKTRLRLGISEAEHDRALEAIGMSASQFALLGMNDASTEGEVCKICFDQSINSVILPCGHYCACKACASMCDACPICRKPIRQVQEIYRA